LIAANWSTGSGAAGFLERISKTPRTRLVIKAPLLIMNAHPHATATIGM